jgi:lipopolysaccharide export system protein LptA
MRYRIITVVCALALVVGSGSFALAQVAIGFGNVTHDASQAVEVTADNLNIDQTNGQAVFAGNVIVVQGDLRMAAGQVQVTYSNTEGDSRVTAVTASGGVLVTRGEDAAEGAEARYDIENGLLVMSGNVLVTQGATAISGDRLTVNMETGNGTVDGRVRTVLGAGDDQ